MGLKIVLFHLTIFIFIVALEAAPTRKRKYDTEETALQTASSQSVRPKRKRKIDATSTPFAASTIGAPSFAQIPYASSTSTKPPPRNKLFCIYCNSEYLTSDGRSNHEFFKHEGNYVRCSTCLIKYTMRQSCIKHLHNVECGGTCETLQIEGWKTDPIRFDGYGGHLTVIPLATSTAEPMLYCRYCNDRLNSVSKRIDHERYEHEGKYEKCTACNRDFTTREAWETHVDTMDCFYNNVGCVTLTVEGFKTRPMIYDGRGGILLQDVRWIAGGMAVDDDDERHLQFPHAHSVEDDASWIPYVTESSTEKVFCVYCNERFVDAPSRRDHERNDHEGRFVECTICHARFGIRQSCNRHLSKTSQNDCRARGGKCLSRQKEGHINDPVQFTGYGGRIGSDTRRIAASGWLADADSGHAADELALADRTSNHMVYDEDGGILRGDASGIPAASATSASGLAACGSAAQRVHVPQFIKTPDNESNFVDNDWTIKPKTYGNFTVGSMASSSAVTIPVPQLPHHNSAGDDRPQNFVENDWTIKPKTYGKFTVGAAASGSAVRMHVPQLPLNNSAGDDGRQNYMSVWMANPLAYNEYGGFPAVAAASERSAVRMPVPQLPHNNLAEDDGQPAFYTYTCRYCGHGSVDYGAHNRHLGGVHPELAPIMKGWLQALSVSHTHKKLDAVTDF